MDMVKNTNGGGAYQSQDSTLHNGAASAFRLPGGGLPAAVKALLTPDNIRAGVHIKGGGVDVVGTLTYLDLLPDNLDIFSASTGLNPLAGGYQIFSGSGSVSIGSTIYVSQPAEYSVTWSGTTNYIYFAKYSTLTLVASCPAGDTGADLRGGYGNGSSFTAYKSFGQAGPAVSLSFDIRSVTGSYRPMFRIYRYGNRNQPLTIYSIRLTV